MGLSISVGLLNDLRQNDSEGADWFRESMAQVNAVLDENGITEHVEPETLPLLESRDNIGGFPYSFLHYLRRFYANVVHDPDWQPTPVAEGEDPTEDPILDQEMYMMSSHLLCHSDCDGFYIPVDFQEVIFDEQDRIPGGMLGSSHRLRDELVLIAPKLQIHLDGVELSDAEAAKINEAVESETNFCIEKMVWLTLFEAARLSLKHKTAISFS